MRQQATRPAPRRTCFKCEATYIEYHKCPEAERQVLGLDLELP